MERVGRPSIKVNIWLSLSNSRHRMAALIVEPHSGKSFQIFVPYSTIKLSPPYPIKDSFCLILEFINVFYSELVLL